MQPTTFQPPEIYDNNGNLIRSGAWGPGTPFYNDTGTGVYDYIANDLEYLQNGVGGAAQSASTAQEAAATATAKVNEALEVLSEATQEASAAQTALQEALAACARAETAAAQAAAIVTPDGLAARVLALENLGFTIVDGEICQTYDVE